VNSKKLSNNVNFDTIEYKSLSEITAERLREMIITGKLEAGAHITEIEVSENMSVSRVVVREAMLMLMRQGLLIKERNRYTKVVEFSRKEVEDIFDLRIAIEQAAAKKCIRVEAVIDRLAIRAQILQQMVAHKDYDKMDLVKCDMGFHNHIIKSSENYRLANVWDEISGLLLSLLFRYTNMRVKFNYSHEEIIRALRECDENVLRQEIERHINDTKHALMDTLDSLLKRSV